MSFGAAVEPVAHGHSGDFQQDLIGFDLLHVHLYGALSTYYHLEAYFDVDV